MVQIQHHISVIRPTARPVQPFDASVLLRRCDPNSMNPQHFDFESISMSFPGPVESGHPSPLRPVLIPEDLNLWIMLRVQVKIKVYSTHLYLILE